MEHQPSFNQQRTIGNLAENKIAQWLIKRGNYVLPIYDTEMESGKGAKLLGIETQLALPDMLAIKNQHIYFVEAKHKTVFSWHRISQKWVTGIDLRHYEHYQQVAKIVPYPIWLLFLHREAYSNKRDEPYPCPTGLFGNALSVLTNCENHRHANWGKTGMVYWSHESLKLLAGLKELYP